MTEHGSTEDQDAPAVRSAIEAAGQTAGADDGAFVEALNQVYRERARGRAERSLSSEDGSADAATDQVVEVVAHSSFRIHDDPRYLRNARELARRSAGGTRVVGGKPVRAGEFLDCVAVGSDAQWACSGTLIGPNVVLTAGHCAKYATRVFFGGDVSKPGLEVRVAERVVHPQYHQGRKNDLMVLLLAERVTTVQPRQIAPGDTIEAATDGRVVGFGHVDTQGRFGYGIKRMVDVPMVSSGCNGTVGAHDDGTSYGCDEGIEIVAGRPLLERDSCKGDSGGPLYVQNAGGDWLLAGATSRATASAMRVCGDGGIYARVDHYRAWIEGIPGVELA
jgi:secreted trypsin-like serine protease